MRLAKTILMALASLTIAITAHAAPNGNIPITYLPFNITAPGTYVLNGNLSYPNETRSTPPAITVASTVAGPVTINLKGFSITGSGQYLYGITAVSVAGGSFYPVTIQNGTIALFDCGISATNANGLVIKNVEFTRNVCGLQFVRVSGSTISACDFTGPAADSNGIIDAQNSNAPNIYEGVTFSKVNQPFNLAEPGAEDTGNYTLTFKPTAATTLN
jgi:hypothetical protein